ncbi:MAG: hypothetical protein NTU44_07140 [Bacteroidetes bacterium]|nr:hypothetical protein [Bacteroidota bacterium]
MKFVAVSGRQLAVSSWQWAVGSWQLAVGSQQSAVGSWQNGKDTDTYTGTSVYWYTGKLAN